MFIVYHSRHSANRAQKYSDVVVYSTVLTALRKQPTRMFRKVIVSMHCVYCTVHSHTHAHAVCVFTPPGVQGKDEQHQLRMGTAFRLAPLPAHRASSN